MQRILDLSDAISYIFIILILSLKSSSDKFFLSAVHHYVIGRKVLVTGKLIVVITLVQSFISAPSISLLLTSF